MTAISKEEVVLMDDARGKQIDNLGGQLREHKKDTKDDFKSVWKAIDMMLFKVAAVVTICTSAVMFIFKAVEAGAK